ncbi:MAG: preprotein translocase subunit SecG [Candidatus Eremiobacteraeota bacterium]|jgi:protein translocase SecG subunit|nr:preprotein translocase subunit SecG [Candidatus Eremiobacteraeota bacterium]MCL5054443.1 preprotein translocase subunit SecG [Bacillota bacterium]
MPAILMDILLAVYFIIALALIIAVTSQTSKNEGMSGIGLVGGKIEAAPYLRKKTMDDQIARITAWLAWSFLILSTIIVILKY